MNIMKFENMINLNAYAHDPQTSLKRSPSSQFLKSSSVPGSCYNVTGQHDHDDDDGDDDDCDDIDNDGDDDDDNGDEDGDGSDRKNYPISSSAWWLRAKLSWPLLPTLEVP